MEKEPIKRIILEKQLEIPGFQLVGRNITLDSQTNYIVVGLRRAGKSCLLYQDIQRKLSNKEASIEDFLFLNFEDERLAGMKAEELGIILDAYGELFPKRRPIIYLDEVQNIDSWEKFARRIADSGYRVRITGSNAKMLSREMATTLGGRYIPKEIYPFSFSEYLAWHHITLSKHWEYSPDQLAQVAHSFDDYFHIGGISEAYDKADKREWLSSLYQKILMGDIVERNRIRNPRIFRLLARKLADSVMQPATQTRLRHIIKSTGENISLPVLADYLQYMEDAYLIFTLPNMVSSFSEKETTKERYFADNGILNLFLLNGETKLLENLVAITLFHLYPNTDEETRLFYYNKGVEVDFCVPETATTYQVSYSIDDPSTYERETTALAKFTAAFPNYKAVIITKNEEKTIQINGMDVNVVPIWKWLLQIEGRQ